MIHEDKAPDRIYIQERVTLNKLDQEALQSAGINTDAKNAEEAIKAAKSKDLDLDLKIRDYMCSTFFDIRTFGAVMTTFVKGSLASGQVRGPVQLGFSRSIDPVIPQEITITRISVTTEKDAETKNNTMGRKYIIPYGLYRANGYISAKLAEKTTGFSEADLALLWKAILNMFEFDRSAARGNMAVRKLYVFKHSSALGDAPSYRLFDSIDIHKKEGVTSPRSFRDYEVNVDKAAIPDTVQITEKVDDVTL
jgi:CRISPR-associated protein Csd2